MDDKRWTGGQVDRKEGMTGVHKYMNGWEARNREETREETSKFVFSSG